MLVLLDSLDKSRVTDPPVNVIHGRRGIGPVQTLLPRILDLLQFGHKTVHHRIAHFRHRGFHAFQGILIGCYTVTPRSRPNENIAFSPLIETFHEQLRKTLLNLRVFLLKAPESFGITVRKNKRAENAFHLFKFRGIRKRCRFAPFTHNQR
ncbi:MAG: hypothetical protein BWY42_00836 [Candidatus Omnitrophica bacterium ADurb.Bin277]|nr:MAG: hypothetical protein BWY42_00836 [Candidatus Omnitrophica bacterium ADurb.Bin277]